MKKLIKSINQNILKSIGQFTLLAAGIGIIWKVAVYSEKLNNNVETIIETQSLQGEQLDTIEDTLYFIKRNVRELDASHNTLRRGFIQYVAKDSTLKTSEFLNYMQGIELDLKKKID